MASRDTARIIVRQIVDAYNRKDIGALEAIYAEDVTLWSSLGEDATGSDLVLGHVGDLFRRLPDEHMTADTVITDGATVVVELTSRGTGASGKPYEICFTEVFDITEGRVSGVMTYIDPEDIVAAEG